MKSTNLPVTVSQSFDACTPCFWQALTNAREKREWFFDNIPDLKP